MTNNWSNVIVRENATLENAIQLLEQFPFQVIIVVDEQKCLLGTLTDGDIRRAILHHQGLDTHVSKIMNANPKSVQEGLTQEDIYGVMVEASINQVPIVNQNNQVTGLETLKHLLTSRHELCCPVVIMAGGFGKRLRPYTNNLPKPMVKIDGKPILEIIIERFSGEGFKQFYITTHYMPEKIESYFGDGKQFGISIDYIHEKKPLGTAGALALLPSMPADSPLIIINGDIVTDVGFRQLLDFHQQDSETMMTMCVRGHDYQVPFGVVDFNDGCLIDIVEKPIQRSFINAGVYIINSDMLSLIEPSQYLDMPTLIKKIIHLNKKVSMFPIIKYWKDVGTISDFDKACEEALITQ